jgi:CDP-glucose 4,6-dehydratase
MLNFYKGKKVLITGATGFKGSWLCLWLSMLGAHVIGTGLKKNSQKLFYQLGLEKKIKVYYLDVRENQRLKKIIFKHKPSIIFHFAAQPLVRESYKYPIQTYEINIMGTINILDIVYRAGFVKSLVCVTTDKVYENKNWVWGYRENDSLGGDDPYSASKAAAEMAINSYKNSFFVNNKKIGVASVRAGNVIGGGDMSKDRIIPDCVRNLLKKKNIIIRNPKANRPWQHVLEPLYGYLILGEKLYKNPKDYSDSFNFGPLTTSILSVKSLVKSIIKIWGYGKLEIKIKKNQPKEQQILQLNLDKSMQKLMWKPIFSLEETIQATIYWYKEVFLNRKSPLKITAEQIDKYQKLINKKNSVL